MREKLKDTGGFTLVEALCAVAILIPLCLMLGAGLGMAMKSYREVTAESETRLLLNTLVNAIAGELRYAHEVTPSGGGQSDFTYNDGRSLELRTDGRVVVNIEGQDQMNFLPAEKNGKGGAYRGGAYQVKDMKISYDKNTFCFTIEKLKVIWDEDNTISAGIEQSAGTPEGGVVIRCLNPPAEETAEGGKGHHEIRQTG